MKTRTARYPTVIRRLSRWNPLNLGWVTVIPACAAVWILYLVPETGNATTYVRVAPGGGAFNDSSRWSPSGVPGSTDRAVFDLSSSYTVSFPTLQLITNESLRIGDDSVVFNLGLSTYRLTDSISIGGSGLFFAGDDGSLQITGGLLSTPIATIGDSDRGGGRSGSGTLVINNGGFNSDSLLTIGGETPGQFNVLGGGATTFLATIGSDAQGAALVSGGASSWTSHSLDVGGNANGSLVISDGGLVTTTQTDQVYLGVAAGVTGTVQVQGTGSMWDSDGPFIVGFNGTGVLNITTGGVVQSSADISGPTILGDQSGSTGNATVSGNNSRWTESSHALYVGNLGTGSLLINGGARATFEAIEIAKHPIGNGSVTVDGSTSQLISYGGLYVGGSEFAGGGTGTLTIGTGARVEVGTAPFFYDGTKVWSGGTINLNGGSLVTGYLELNGGAFNWSSGFLHLTGDGLQLEPGGLFGPSLSLGSGFGIRAASIDVGTTGDGSLSATDGASVHADYGFMVGGSAEGTVDVSNAFLINGYSAAVIGDQASGRGNVTISNGGHYDTLGLGFGTAELVVGRYGEGTLNIQSGSLARVLGQTEVYLGKELGGMGILNIDGALSEMSIEIRDIFVGFQGQGQLKITNGGQLYAPSFAFAGYDPGSTGEINLGGAGRMTTPFVTIGNYGTGTLRIETGGELVASEVTLGLGAQSSGTALVDGAGSKLSALGGNGYLIVGGGSNGSLTVSGAGLAEAQEVIIGDGFAGVGNVLVAGDGSELRATEAVFVGFNGNGTLTVADGAIVTAPEIQVNLSDTLAGNGTVYGNVANYGGRVRPGSSAGQLTIVGDYAQSSDGRLDVELRGLAPGTEHDVLELTGIANLDGTLGVEMIDGYIPSPGDSWFVLTAAGGVSNEFAAIDGPSTLTWDVIYGQTYAELVVGFHDGDFDRDADLDGDDADALVSTIAAMTHDPAFDLTGDGMVTDDDLTQWLADAGAVHLPSGNPYLRGDSNLDGTVDGSDFINWNSNKFTELARWTGGDFNADGVVDGVDFVLWNTNKFTSSFSGPPTVVPEPNSLVFTIISLALLAARRCRTGFNLLRARHDS